MSYRAPVKDMMFTLEHVAGLDEIAQIDAFAHAESDLVEGILRECGRFCSEVVAPTNEDGDIQHSRMVDGGVTTPESFKGAYDSYVQSGWGALQFPEEFGGGNFPTAVATAAKEMITAANMAWSLNPLLTTGAVVDLLEHGDDYLQQTFLPKMVTGEWSGTMNLSEPQAGSDVGALTTKAVPNDDGTYAVTGTKIWITWGEHDLTENICHLVLARLPDAPVGTKGISLFLVPKFLVNDDGSLGDRNAVQVVGVEDKLGINASPTCVMEYDNAVGYMVGGPNQGMRQMFTMMNDARLGVGVQGLAISDRAYQMAVDYAIERRQGLAPGDEDTEKGQSRIVAHPDVRRMLLTMRSQIEAMRALTYRNAAALDHAHHSPDEAKAEYERKMADLLTPLSKAWSTDLGVELTSIAIQVFGGMGYVEETGVARHFRDARIAPIYEGTNGIQAMDLLGRKLPMDGGAYVKGFMAEMREVAESLDDEAYGAMGSQLVKALDTVEEATTWLMANRTDFSASFGGATPFLRMFATTVAGYLLAVGAKAAQAKIEAGEEDPFYADKLTTARFYCDNILPTVHGLLDATTAGADDLFAIDADRLQSA
ncbi:acyl-CoA dehydrogenase [Euzebya tangerina]|uniref:acyl-CoA dehydrogenase n=1 Tax=Euzebya tangerina TaxID=591198 RepID=UPI000E319D7C|nr:acyl-CoA dehydrogenase [Euzebya tangerina]